MSACHAAKIYPVPRRERGFTLVELMVAMAVAIFLLGGLGIIVQNLRKESANQQALAQLQDEQRFAMTLLADVVQAAGYYPDATNQTVFGALPAVAAPIAGQVAMAAGQPFDGFHSTGNPNARVPDSLTVRFETSGNDAMIMCDGSQNVTGAPVRETNVFTVVPAAGNVPGQLLCSVNGNPAVALVNGVQDLEVFYGVNRNAPTLNYSIDTYLTADQMNPALPGGGDDWMNISAVRIVLTFTNPLCPTAAACQPGQLPTVTFERVVPVMARAGFHS